MERGSNESSDIYEDRQSRAGRSGEGENNGGCCGDFNLTIICLQFCCDLAIIYHTPHEVMRVPAIFNQKK